MNAYRLLPLLCWSVLAALTVGHRLPAATIFPLKVSENRRHVVDQRNTPFFYHADTAWLLFNKLTEAEAAEYLAARRSQGFTALQVQLTGFLGMTNRAGQLPFGGTPPEQNFSQPNEKFFGHVDRVVAEAERKGLLLAIAPTWSGCCGEGWSGKGKDGSLKPLNLNGAEASRELGRWLGKRYGKFANVMWILGGDNDPDNARAEIRALGLGLKENAPQQLITYHAASTHSSTDVWPAAESWREVLELPGANSLKHLRALLDSRAWWKLVPDVNNVVAVEGRGAFATNDYAVTALALDGSFAFSYLPTKRTLTIDLSKISGAIVTASWFNPRTGEATSAGSIAAKKRHNFEPPTDGDWVLVIDDANKKSTVPRNSPEQP